MQWLLCLTHLSNPVRGYTTVPIQSLIVSLAATDLSWRGADIAQAYTLRWLAEVFSEDWKLHEGWGREAGQFDEEGAVRGLILSLLSDLALLLHPEQTARLEKLARLYRWQPAKTGSDG